MIHASDQIKRKKVREQHRFRFSQCFFPSPNPHSPRFFFLDRFLLASMEAKTARNCKLCAGLVSASPLRTLSSSPPSPPPAKEILRRPLNTEYQSTEHEPISLCCLFYYLMPIFPFVFLLRDLRVVHLAIGNRMRYIVSFRLPRALFPISSGRLKTIKSIVESIYLEMKDSNEKNRAEKQFGTELNAMSNDIHVHNFCFGISVCARVCSRSMTAVAAATQRAHNATWWHMNTHRTTCAPRSASRSLRVFKCIRKRKTTKIT